MDESGVRLPVGPQKTQVREGDRFESVWSIKIMSFINLFELITSITGILMSFGYFLQAKKILRYKSAHDISLAQYVILGIGTATWTAYGIYTHDMVIVLGFLLGAIGSWLVFFLALKYRAPSAALG